MEVPANLPSARPRYEPLVVVAIAAAGGIVLDRYRAAASDGIGFWDWWCISVGCLAIWWLVWRRRRAALAAWPLLVAVALAASAWHDLRWRLFPVDDVSRYAAFDATPACATAFVLNAPEILPAPRPTPLRAIPGGERSRVAVRLTGIRDVADWLPAGGRCQLTVDGHLLGLHAGDRVRLFGQLRRPLPPMNPGQFDFAAAARADRRLASLVCGSPECVTVVEPAGRWSPQHLIDAVRASGERIIAAYVGPRRAGLASAILLGAREGLPTEEVLPYFLTGTVHLLVVSGLNVGILATGLWSLAWMGWLPRRVVLAAIIAIVAAYTLVADAQPPVLRAAVLVVIVCAAAWSGRRALGFNSLAAAALLVLAINPSELFRTGAQLSFLCVAVLICVGQASWDRRRVTDPLDRLIAESRPWHSRGARFAVRWTVLLLLTSAAVWLATLPLVLYRFHLASPIALAISPLVWLLALVAMWAGFLTLAGGWLMPLLAYIAGPICSAALSGLAGAVNWAEGVPGGFFFAPGPAWWWVIGFYVGLFAVMYRPTLVAWRWQVGLLGGWILVGLLPPLVQATTRGDELRCSFVAMGHGTCVVLETPDGQTILYDAGSLGIPEYAMETVAGYLWFRGHWRIDAVILSHADVDHYNAVPGLLERFGVGAVYVSPLMFDEFGATGPPRGPETLRLAIERSGVPLDEVWSGDRLRIGGVTLEVIHPPRLGVIGRDNANSVTVLVEYAGRRLLLPGDLETPGLDDVIAELPVDCDVVMAPHHGSRRSDPPGFAAWSTPEWVVISGGADDDPEVRQTYEAAGAEVLNTGEVGAIEFALAGGVGEPIHVTTWRAADPQ